LRAEPIDPRDAQVVLDAPAYRVYIWRRPDGPSSDQGLSCQEWRLSDVTDVREVLHWAQERSASPQEAYEVFAEMAGQPVTLLRLVPARD
jgi:hypothetical protein